MIFACPLEYLTSKNSHAPWIRAVNQGLIGGCSVPKEPEDIQKLLETLVKEELISLPKIAKILAHSQDLQLQKLIVEVLV
jgi:hypothetical protein